MLKEITYKEAVQMMMFGLVQPVIYEEVAKSALTLEEFRMLSDSGSLKFFVEVEEDPEEKKKAAPAKKKRSAPTRKDLDEGKIMALHKAGWNNLKIADEMGVSNVTIGKRLAEIKSREEQK